MPIDKSNYLEVLESFPKQCKDALMLTKGMTIAGKFSNIAVCGMGGSAIGGDLLASYLHNSDLPVFVIRDYSLPDYINQNSLVFIVSYSGNTEETLAVYEEAKRRKCIIFAITSGGQLAELCQKKILIPIGLQPRAALPYLFFPMLGLLHNTGIVSISNKELNEMISQISAVEKYKEAAQDLSKKLRDKLPIIYASDLLYPVAYRFKTQINENSKLAAFCHRFPEMNHNEIVGYKNMERSKYVVILIMDAYDNPRNQKRMNICAKIMQDKVDVITIKTKGEHLLTRMFSTIFLGDLVSYYLAMFNREDPAPVEVIEKLKDALR